MDEKDIIVIFCPPISEYKEQLTDQSKCTVEICPECKKAMWLSEKKKGMMALANALKKDILLSCYKCFRKKILTDKDFSDTFKNHTRIDL